MSVDAAKQAAAVHAATLVQDGMFVGLGSGSTAELLVGALGERWKAGLRFTGVATSGKTAAIAESYGIDLTRLDALRELDLTIDGADEVDPRLNLVKGRGGALLREKLVASAARRFVIIVDPSKLVSRLGEHAPIPVEVAPFGWTTTRHRLELLGFSCDLRGGDVPYVTDNGNFILDCHSGRDLDVADPAVAGAIKYQTGVVDHGLFLGLAQSVVVGHDNGTVETLTAR